MELKYEKNFPDESVSDGFNRTFMELKSHEDI